MQRALDVLVVRGRTRVRARQPHGLLRETLRSITYINPQAPTQTDSIAEQADDVEETRLKIRQVTSNARTLVRARRHADAEKVINEGLELFPWQSSLWFWKLATKIGNSREAIQAWDMMTRLGVQKNPEHYDIMSAAICFTDARHMVLELYRELKSQKVVGNPKFYIQMFQACSGMFVLGQLGPKAQKIWRDMQESPDLVHLTHDPDVRMSYQALTAAYGTTQAKDSLENASHAARTQANRSLSGPAIAQELESRISSSLPAERFLDSSTRSSDALEANEHQKDQRSLNHESSPGPRLNTAHEPLDVASPTVPAESLSSELRNSLEPFFGSHRKDTAQHDDSLKQARTLMRATPVVNIHNYNYMMRSAARVQEPEALLELLEEAIERGLKPNTTTYAPIIRSFFARGRPQEALDLLERMEISNVTFNMKTVSIVLKGLLENEQEDAAISFFVDIIQGRTGLLLSSSYDESRDAFTILMHGLVDSGRNVDAQKLLTIMLQKKLQPSLKTYNALVRGAFSQGMVVEGMQYYDLAIKSPDLERTNFNWRADMDELIAAVVSGFLEKEHYQEAEGFINDAAAKGTWHSTTSKPYTYFIAWLARHERLDEAWNLFDHHKTRFDKFSTYKLYSVVLKAIYLERGDIYGAVRWLKAMEKLCTIPDQIPFHELLSAAMTNGERYVGEQVWSDALEHIRRSGQVMSPQMASEGSKWGLKKEL